MKRIIVALLAMATFVSCSSPVEKKEINFVFKEATDNNLVAKYKDVQITQADLDKNLGGQISKAMNKPLSIKFNKIRAFVLEDFMSKDSRKKNLTNDEFLEKHIVKNVKVSERKIKAFAKEKKITKEQVNNPQMKAQIKQFLLMQEKRKKIESWMARVAKRNKVVVYMNIPSTSEGKVMKESTPFFVFKAPEKDGTILTIKGVKYNFDAIFGKVKNEIYEAKNELHMIKLNAVKTVLVEKVIAADPRRAKFKTNEEFLVKHIYKESEVSEKEINTFITQRNIPATAVNPQLKTRIVDFIKVGRKSEQLNNWIAKLTVKDPVEVYFLPPQRPVFDVSTTGVFSGGKDAKVVITEFTDYECPFCSKGNQIINEVKKKYGKKVRVIFKHFPLPFHKKALFAHKTAICANNQKPGSLWKLTDIFFADQSKLDKESILKEVKSLKIDQAKFDDCVASKETQAIIDRDFTDGQNVGVTSTPTFFVNGKLIMGAQPVEVFSKLIDEELNKTK